MWLAVTILDDAEKLLQQFKQEMIAGQIILETMGIERNRKIREIYEVMLDMKMKERKESG